MRTDHPDTEAPTMWGSTSGIATAPATPLEDKDEARSEKKKEKKRRKKEEKRRKELLERFSLPTNPTPPAGGAAQNETPEHPLTAEPMNNEGKSGKRVEAWSRTTARALTAKQLIIAQRANVLIGVNALMLSVAAFSVYRTVDLGELWWAFIPLGLTNLLSLVFALISARVSREITPLDELCSMPQETYQGALMALVNDKERVSTVLANEIYQLGGELTRREKHLGTALNVLLGGLPLSAMMFGVCFAFLK